MERYSGTFLMIRSLIEHYVLITGPYAVVAVSIGLAAIVLSVVMRFSSSIRRYSAVVLLLSVLPLPIGIAGTIHIHKEVRGAAALEERSGEESTAKRHFDWEYGYNELSLYLFPVISGILGSSLPLLLWSNAMKRKR